jgi:hypothetical protein
MVTWSPSLRYPARVARPRGGNSEYFIGRQKGLLASVSAGRIILTFMTFLHIRISVFLATLVHCRFLAIEYLPLERTRKST